MELVKSFFHSFLWSHSIVEGLYELWRTNRYASYPPSVLVDLVARILALVPPWTRVYRVQRDIPMPLVTSGVEHGNLREHALARMRDLNLECRDVRTREVGIQEIHNRIKPEQVELIRRDYVANDGWETFLAYEDPEQDILIGLLRLRKCTGETFRPELKRGQVSIVRELHVYGSVVPVHAKDPSKFQHQVGIAWRMRCSFFLNGIDFRLGLWDVVDGRS